MRIGRSELRVAGGAGLAVLGLAVLGNALSPAAGEIRSEDLRIPVRNTVFEGTIVAPPKVGSYPAVVLVHGAGPGRQSDLIELAGHFARAGIVALAYDERTVGYSAVTNRDFGLLAEDALAAVGLLRQRDDVNPARVGLWGISEGGGWVVPIAASAISTHLLLNVLLGVTIALAVSWSGSPLVVNGGWLVVRLVALVSVVLAVTSAEAAVSAVRSGWRPTRVQAMSLVGSFGATGVLLLVAAYWDLFALRW